MSNKVLKCKSRELRGGQLYTSCDCTRRNGLQCDCPRRDCLMSDQKSCLIRPSPKCCASFHAKRFENVSMGIPGVPSKMSSVNQYNPRGEKVQINPPNPCGPKYE